MAELDPSLDHSKAEKLDSFTTAYQLQEYISFLNKELAEAKKALTLTYDEIMVSGVTQNGKYRMVHSEQWVRKLDSALFYQAHPEEFIRYAKITLSNAELVLSPEELERYVHRKRRDIYSVEKMPMTRS